MSYLETDRDLAAYSAFIPRLNCAIMIHQCDITIERRSPESRFSALAPTETIATFRLTIYL